MTTTLASPAPLVESHSTASGRGPLEKALVRLGYSETEEGAHAKLRRDETRILDTLTMLQAAGGDTAVDRFFCRIDERRRAGLHVKLHDDSLIAIKQLDGAFDLSFLVYAHQRTVDAARDLVQKTRRKMEALSFLVRGLATRHPEIH